jgi:hypothetical protein
MKRMGSAWLIPHDSHWGKQFTAMTGKSQWNILLGRDLGMWWDNIKIYYEGTGPVVVQWIHTPQNSQMARFCDQSNVPSVTQKQDIDKLRNYKLKGNTLPLNQLYWLFFSSLLRRRTMRDAAVVTCHLWLNVLIMNHPWASIVGHARTQEIPSYL